jgi:hypothetical protein
MSQGASGLSPLALMGEQEAHGHRYECLARELWVFVMHTAKSERESQMRA